MSVGVYLLNGQHPLSSLPPNTSVRPQGGHGTATSQTDRQKGFHLVSVCVHNSEIKLICLCRNKIKAL